MSIDHGGCAVPNRAPPAIQFAPDRRSVIHRLPMAVSPLSIWTNASLPAEAMSMLQTGVGQHNLTVSAKPQGNLTLGDPDPAARQAQVIFGQPHVEDLLKSQSLRWVQLTSAGYARYDRDDLRNALRTRQTIMSNSSGVFSEPCAEHLLAMMLAFARALPDAGHSQTRRKWNATELRARSFLLSGQVAIIVGMGSIARRLCEMLAPLGVRIVGFRRTVRGDEPVRTLPIADLDGMLPKADHVLDILPSAAGNEMFFNTDRLGRMKPGAIFYNIGRGDTVDQYALRACLETGHLRGAYLDVTTPEPLPADDPLWTTPNCHITPHTAGGHAMEFNAVVAHFLANLRRFERGQDLTDRIV